jgi:receptor protein-tyrosine kinase
MDHSQKQAQLAASANMAAHASTSDLRLGSLLVEHGIITDSQVNSILARAHKDRVPFGEAAVLTGQVTERELDRIIALQFRHQLANPVKSRISPEVVAAFSSTHRVANEVRALRSQLMLQWLSEKTAGNRALAVVSADSGEGRSFLAANLAAAFAQSGHRTLLIDGDMRSPRQHKLFGLANETGLSSVLSGRAKGSFVYRLADLPGLSIMTAGGIPPNPAELLSPDALNRLFERCAHKYQIVIVDTPAHSAGPDAGLIASQTSGYLMMGSTGRTGYDAVQSTSKLFADMGANLVGSVLTD